MSVTTPPTSLPKSSTTYAPLPTIAVAFPVSTLFGFTIEPFIAWTATGASVRLAGA
ncbi:MAG TPA: hypothetical protein VH560_12615 [Polyangia bacterium]|nr:hypothetical protein [Polyangia bacterium]